MKFQQVSAKTNTRAKQLLAIGFGSLAIATNLLADVDINPRWADVIPTIDGVVTLPEWNYSTITTLRAGEVRMHTKNDAEFLYVLLDVQKDTSGAYPGYALTIDVDRNLAVTDGGDFAYTSRCPAPIGSPILFGKAVFGSPGIDPCVAVDPGSQAAFGFQDTLFFEDNGAWPPHRVCEFRLSLAELGVGGERFPNVRLRVNYGPLDAPFAPIDEPTGGGPDGFTRMFRVRLATTPSFSPRDSYFASVGRVPRDRIGADGYANVNFRGYVATDAPFGGDLNIFLNRSAIRPWNAERYRLAYSADGGASWTPLRQTFTNARYIPATPTTDGRWEEIAIAPDRIGAYPTPDQRWLEPNLLVTWQTLHSEAHLSDGEYLLQIDFLNPAGRLLATDRMPLFLVNTPPEVAIHNVYLGGSANPLCECAIVKLSDRDSMGLQWEVSVNDRNGALDAFSFTGIWGNDRPPLSLYSPRYANGFADVDGPNRWEGTHGRLRIPPGVQWRTTNYCAYTFTLSASSRTQNGYQKLFPDVHRTTSLTILREADPSRGTNAGCP